MHKQSLNGSWLMTDASGASYSSQVPGGVLATLLENQVIPDPFDGQNETIALEKLREDYAFERTFDVDESTLKQPQADLVFEGIDTLASIFLNGHLLAKTDNMHRTWRFPVKQLLHTGQNTLHVSFSSPVIAAEKAAADNPDIHYVNTGGTKGSSLIRKAHYMYGWDWGPQLPDMGLWRSVRLESYTYRLENVRFEQRHEEGRVWVTAHVETKAPKTVFRLYAPDGTLCAQTQGTEELQLCVDNPKLWWPNGLGEHPLYRAQILLFDGETLQDEASYRLGLRTMTVSIEPDEFGESFALCCNGVPFFAMGADYIPEDNLLSRVTPEATRRLLTDCVRANFNCLRVWGGGVYPDDSFFDICDELGLVIWQDLMFACNVYKMSEAFEENIEQEARDNLRRIRHHASLGLVCANNEMEIAWVEWDRVAGCHSQELKAHYLHQFEFVLKRICLKETPDVFFWPSSPSSGGCFDDPGDMNRGDVHDWSIWHGGEPFENYAERYPRFCSEFGFESFPAMETIKTFIHKEADMNPFSPVMEAHQKCLSGNGRMLFYLSQQLRYPFDMEQLVLDTQYIQAEAMRTGVEHWRRNRGRCMGAIYWQLNDCWPVASWASIDSLNRWKALHYAARRFFAPILISVRRKDHHCQFVISSESREAFSGTLVWKLRNARGAVLEEGSMPANCSPLTAKTLLERTFDGPSNDRVLQFYLCDEKGERVSEGIELFDAPKRLLLTKPNLSCELTKADENTCITIHTDTLALGVSVSGADCTFSDNWFPVYPDEPRCITADTALSEVSLHYIL